MARLSLNPDFDAQVVAVVDGYLGHEESRPGIDTHLFYTDSAKFSRIPSSVLMKAGSLKEIEGRQQTQSVKDTYRESFTREVVESGFPQEVAEIILDSKLQLIFLINSVDGPPFYEAEAKKISSLVHANGGETRSYGFSRMFGTGARMWEQGDKRYVMDRTATMWNVGMYNDSEDSINVEKARMAARFSPIQYYYNSGSIERKIQNPDNTKGNIRFTGRQLHQGGLAEEAFIKIADVRRHFQHQLLPILDETDPYDDNIDAVTRFWMHRKYDETLMEG